MSSKSILFMLSAIVYAEIKVELTGNLDPSIVEIKVICSGRDKNLISDTEKQTFKLTDDNLRYGAMQQFDNQPNQAYLGSPNYWGDLYQSHNWTPVTTNLRPVDCKVLKATSEPQIVVQQLFENNCTVPVAYKVDISHITENTLLSTWSKDGELTVSKDIAYEFNVELLNSGGSISISYLNPWGINTEKKQAMNIGQVSSVEVMVQPKDAVSTLLHSVKGTVSLQLNYEAKVAGDVIFHYDAEYKGHKFWELAVDTVMSKAGLINSVKSKEVIDMTIVVHSKVVVNNKVDAKKITEVFV